MGHFNQHFVHNFYRSNNFPPHKDIHVIFQIGMEQNSRLQFQGKINSLLMKAFIVHVILQMTSLHDTSVQDKQELNFNKISYYKEYEPFSSSRFTISPELCHLKIRKIPTLFQPFLFLIIFGIVLFCFQICL